MKKRLIKTVELENDRLGVFIKLPPESIIDEVIRLDYDIKEIERKESNNELPNSFVMRPDREGRALLGFVVNKSEFVSKSFAFADYVQPSFDLEELS